LAARKFLEKSYPGESTFVDISDYSSRVGLSGQASTSSEVEVKVLKVDKVPGGCLHFAISLVPEAHPLAEDRVATIVLLGGLDLPVPDSVIDKLSGQIQNVYFVIERGFSRTTSSPKVDCEGRPQFVDQISPEEFQGSQAALVEFDQENSMITVKIHRKEPPKNKALQYPSDKKEGEEEEGEEEEVDDVNDDLIAFCEFNLWDLVDIERGNNQVDLLERITKTFDCLAPADAIRVLSNECHSSMVNIVGRSLIELKDFKAGFDEGAAEIKEGGFLSAFKSKVVGVFQEQAAKAQEAVDSAKGALLDKFGGLLDDPEEDNADQPDEDPEAVDVQNKIFIAKKQFKRTIASLRTLVGIFFSAFAYSIVPSHVT
jgi:hypothetical protein